jgi:hypothetical protein
MVVRIALAKSTVVDTMGLARGNRSRVDASTARWSAIFKHTAQDPDYRCPDFFRAQKVRR